MYQTLNINPHINPAFAARVSHERQPVLAKLPLAPINASPVPHLTSLYHDDQAGDFGNRGYPAPVPFPSDPSQPFPRVLKA